MFSSHYLRRFDLVAATRASCRQGRHHLRPVNLAAHTLQNWILNLTLLQILLRSEDIGRALEIIVSNRASHTCASDEIEKRRPSSPSSPSKQRCRWTIPRETYTQECQEPQQSVHCCSRLRRSLQSRSDSRSQTRSYPPCQRTDHTDASKAEGCLSCWIESRKSSGERVTNEQEAEVQRARVYWSQAEQKFDLMNLTSVDV